MIDLLKALKKEFPLASVYAEMMDYDFRLGFAVEMTDGSGRWTRHAVKVPVGFREEKTVVDALWSGVTRAHQRALRKVTDAK